VPTVRLGALVPEGHLARSHDGAWVAARTTIGSNEIVLVSLHGLHETFQLSSTRYAVSTVQRSLSDLTPLLDVHRSQMPVILAGDLNVNLQLPWPDGDAHRAVIDRIKAFGLVDCLGSSDGDQIPTHRYLNNPSSTPYEDDWLFASPTLRLLDCQPVDTEEGWALSDHCPVVARFELHSPH
jgi:endonuclease/exonuclease/phosphatase (EEP) superfamily protein YafD